MKAPVSDPRSANWQEVVPHRANVMLDDTDFFKNYYVLSERENGLPQMQVTDLATGKSRASNFRSLRTRVIRMPTANMTPAKFRYGYQSFITPRSVFEYDMATGKSTLLKQKEVPGGYDRTKYQVEQIYAPASDGVKVPISVVHLKSAKMDGTGPMYLTAYGSYGIPATSPSTLIVSA